jgi:hypothetical protein
VISTPGAATLTPLADPIAFRRRTGLVRDDGRGGGTSGCLWDVSNPQVIHRNLARSWHQRHADDDAFRAALDEAGWQIVDSSIDHANGSVMATVGHKS